MWLICISTNLPCDHTWLVLQAASYKLQKQICRTVGPSLAAPLEPLAHQRKVAAFILFFMYYFGRCSSELAQLVPLPYSQGRSTCYSDRFHAISTIIPRSYLHRCLCQQFLSSHN